MGQGLGFLLKEAEFLKVVRRKAHEVRLPGNRNLEVWRIHQVA